MSEKLRQGFILALRIDAILVAIILFTVFVTMLIGALKYKNNKSFIISIIFLITGLMTVNMFCEWLI